MTGYLYLITIFILSFIKNVQNAKYKIVQIMIIIGKAVKPIKPVDKNKLATNTSMIMANNKKCPIGWE